MKVLVPVDASSAALAPISHLADLAAAGVPVEVLLVNVQPRFHRHVSQFTSPEMRDSLRAELSRAAMAQAIEELSKRNFKFTALAETGAPAARIAAVAEREGVDEIVMGVGRHPAWLRWFNPSIAQGVMERTDIPVTVLARGRAGAIERYALPAAVTGIAALLISTE